MQATFLENAPLFSSLLPDEQQIVGNAMKELTFGKGETLFSQGQPNQRLYLIKTGWVKQSTQLESGRTLVNNLGPGSLVGDMDVLLEQPASSTAIANSDICVWSLPQSDLHQVLDENPRIGLKLSAALGSRIKQVDRYLVEKRLHSTDLFSDLGEEHLQAIAEKLEPMEIRRGGLIFRAGAPGDAMFIIEEGEVVLTSAAEETGEPFRQLDAGDVMGEMAVLTGKPYDGLARAASQAVLWVLHRDDFLTVTSRFPNIRSAMSSRLSQPLSSDDRILAQQQLSKLRLFGNLPADAAKAVAGVLVLRHFPAGERMFNAGDPGDSMFIVDGGNIRICGESGQEVWLSSGEEYGETCLLTGRSRTETAVAESDSNVWLLYKSDFDELLARFPALGASLSKAVGGYLTSSTNLFLDHQLRSNPLFAGLGEDELRDIANALHSLRANRGDVIFAEGQRGDAVYFIETGEVQLATRAGDSYQMNFERLIAGDFFGELALLADNPRSSTARAVVGDTQLWALYKADFDRIAVQYPQVALSLSKVLGERLARTSPRNPAPNRPQARPPSSGPLLTGTRPLTAKPSSVPAVRRPMAAPPAIPSNKAAPLTVKPPAGPRPPQARPMAKQPPPPLVAPKPRGAAQPQVRVDGMPKPAAVDQRPDRMAATPKPGPGDQRQTRMAAAPKPPVARQPQVRVQSKPGPRVAGAPQARAVAARPAPRRPEMALQPYADPVTLAVVDSFKWVMARSLGFKFRMAALSMLLVWLCGITAPVAALSAMSMQGSGTQFAVGGVAVNVGTTGNGPLPVQLALVPTFTPTPPPTRVPVKAATVDANPSAPAVLALAATKTPLPKPTARPRPSVTPTPAQPVAAEVQVPATPTVEFKIKQVRQLTPCENMGNHNLYVIVLDAQGNGLPGVDIEFSWSSGSIRDRTGRKVENIPALGVNAQTTAGFIDWPIYKGDSRARVVSGTSEQTDWLKVALPDQRCDKNDDPIGNSTFHYSYLIVFQRTY